MYLKRVFNKPYYLLFLSILLLTHCKLGPNFQSPAPVPTTQYVQDTASTKTVGSSNNKGPGKAQTMQWNQDIPGQWWDLFHSPELNELILAGLRNNPTLAAAKAAVINAQENYRAQVGQLYPNITGQFSLERQRFSFAQFGDSNSGAANVNVFNVYTLNLAATYTLDVFGGIRRQIEAAGAKVEYQQFELEGAFLTLSSSIAITAIEIASLKAQIQATNDLIRAQENTLHLTKNQYTLGGASESDVLLQENQLAQLKATLPPIKQALAIDEHALSTLVGILPTEHTLPTPRLAQLHLPADIPLSCPTLLARQRPDIRAAESLLHAASALIGVATANLFPQFVLNSTYGQMTTHIRALFDAPDNFWSIASAVTQPLFAGGSLLAQRRAAIAAYEQAAAQYQQTVLQAFQSVADGLRALEHDAQLFQAQRQAEIAAQRALTLIQKQYRLGGVNYLNLLTAQKNYQEARLNRIQAQSARFLDTVLLFQSLGGGWWNRCLLHCNPLLTDNLQQYRPEIFGKG